MFLLPAGYFVLEEYRVAGNEAVLAGTFGPIPRQRPGLRNGGCGTEYALRWAVSQTADG